MNSLNGKKVLIFQQRGWGINVGHFLAKKFQTEGCKLSALTFKRTTHKFITDQQEVAYELIISSDDIMNRPKDYLAGDKFSLEEICRELGVDSIWPLVTTLRNHIRSYEDKFYYSYKQKVSDEEIIDYVMAAYKCVKTIFSQFSPDIIIAPNFVALLHIMMNLYAAQRGIEMITITESKIKGIYIFSHGYRDDKGDFFDRVDELNSGKSDSPNRSKAKKYIQEFRQEFKKPDDFEDMCAKNESDKKLIRRFRHHLAPIKDILRWYLRKKTSRANFNESIGITIDYRPPRIILRDHFCRDKYKKFADSYKYYPLDKIKKFIYFPLQFQPESSIDVMAPFFNNQIETARLIAMSMPDDYTLVVKEHPAMIGLRPPSYLEKVAKTVNVKLIDYRLSSEEVLKKSDMMISPNSTTLAEAAFLRKPAIQMGNLGITLKLPNVFHHTDMTSLAAKIKEILSISLETDEYERKLENFTAAAFDKGIDLDYLGAWEKGEDDHLENLWEIYKNHTVKILEKNL